MTFKLYQRLVVSLGCATVLNLPITGLSSSWLAAQASTQNSNQSTLSEFPGRRVGGGSRGECLSTDRLVALSPKNHLIKTNQATPTIYLEMPAFEDSLMVELIVKNAEGDIIADQFFEVRNNRGITGLDLTNHVEPLEIGQNYEWYISVICNEHNRAYDLVVHGWIQRVPDTVDAIATSTLTLTEQVKSYHEQGLWYDAIALLIESQDNFNGNIYTTELWAELLETEGLQQLITTFDQTNF